MFTHLRVHSTYSTSEGVSTLDDMINRAVELGLPAMALTDKNNMFGAMSFSKMAASKGVQPLVGCQFYFPIPQKKKGNILLIAKNEIGYQNLCKIVNEVSVPTENGTDEKLLRSSLLESNSDGLIMLTGGGKDGFLPELAKESPDKAKEVAQWFLHLFGDRVYIEICRNHAPTLDEAKIEDTLMDMAYGGIGKIACKDGIVRNQIPLVATSDIWYATPNRHKAYVIIDAVNNKKIVSTKQGILTKEGVPEFALSSDESMRELFSDIPEAYENAVNIAKRSAFMVQGRRPMLPQFPVETGLTEAEELRRQAHEGLKERFDANNILGEDAKTRINRLEYELDVIEKMGFPGYFLIVSDFIKWAKSKDIPVGPGRGSGAGSIVAWSLKITDLDPVRYNLLFERFLNPDRVSMPDFDIDFCQDRRDEVREYVKNKYGADRVGLISTFTFSKSKTTLKDVARVIVDDEFGGVGFGEINALNKLIPTKEGSQEPVSLQQAYELSPAFAEAINSSPKMRTIFEASVDVAGVVRQSGSHAAGIVIGDQPLDKIIPVHFDAKANINVAGFDMKGVETAGLVKFDFLGLTTLSVLKLAQNYVKGTRNVDIDLLKIPMDDENVYKMLSLGFSAGVFQFESAGMRKVLKQIKPERFEDLIAIVALFRPGPMAYIANYAARKAGKEDIVYPGGEKTKKYLEETYGIMVYQEQVMQVAQACAGYSLAGADLLRRAMGKKIQSEMDIQRSVFVNGKQDSNPPIPGAVTLGMSEEEANKLFDDIVPFAGYGFNKSHAAAYAFIGYQTAWMKFHYPAEFLSALMSYNTNKPERLDIIKDELDIMGIPLLPPDVNKSMGNFIPEKMDKVARGGVAIRFGLAAVKKVGEVGKLIGPERIENGEFGDIIDFYNRVGKKINDGQYKSLAEVGAFDSVSPSRRVAYEALSWLSKNSRRQVNNDQSTLFGEDLRIEIPTSISDLKEWENISEIEYNAVGFYFKDHPLDLYLPRLKVSGVKRKESVYQWMVENQRETLDGRKLCGMVESVNLRQTKKGSTYIEVMISEKSDSYRIAYYPKNRYNSDQGDDFKNFLHLVEGAKLNRHPVVFLCSLSLSSDKGGVWVNAQNAWHIEKFLANVHGEIIVHINSNLLTLAKDEHNIIKTGIDPKSEGTLTPKEATTLAHKMATVRVVSNLVRYLEKSSVSAKDKGSPIIVSTEFGEFPLKKLYEITPNVLHIIRQTDGVVSVMDYMNWKQNLKSEQNTTLDAKDFKKEVIAEENVEEKTETISIKPAA